LHNSRIHTYKNYFYSAKPLQTGVATCISCRPHPSTFATADIR